MGTRADFYTGIDPTSMVYLGSIAWDGYDIGPVAGATSEDEYHALALAFIASRDDGTLAERDGWPWPWDDSRTTDRAYTWHDGRVMSANGDPERWVPYPPRWGEYDDLPAGYDEAIPAQFPDMKALKRVTYGRRSGLIVITTDGIVSGP